MKSITILLLFLTSVSLSSQILATRNIIPVPEVDTSSVGYLFDKFEFGGDIATGGGSTRQEMAWSYKLFGFSEIYRFTENSTLSFLMTHELNANPHNDISFNPRKAIWEENIRYYNVQESSAWMAGFFHRCKHDVDNADPPKEGVLYKNYQPINRVLILTGLNAGYFLFNEFGDFSLNQKFMAEYYILSSDVRTPFSKDSATWDDMTTSIRWTGSLDYDLSKLLDLRLLAYLSTSIINTDLLTTYNTFNFDYRFEFDFVLKGRGNNVEFFIGYERMFDDVSFIRHRETNFWNVGIRLRPGSFR